MEEDYSFEKAETRYKIETADKRQMLLYLNANKLACALYDLMEWRRSVYNGKDYSDGHVLYKGKLYTKNEWFNLEHEEDEYDEEQYLKDKPYYIYTDDDIEYKLNGILEDVVSFVADYMGM